MTWRTDLRGFLQRHAPSVFGEPEKPAPPPPPPDGLHLRDDPDGYSIRFDVIRNGASSERDLQAFVGKLTGFMDLRRIAYTGIYNLAPYSLSSAFMPYHVGKRDGYNREWVTKDRLMAETKTIARAWAARNNVPLFINGVQIELPQPNPPSAG